MSGDRLSTQPYKGTRDFYPPEMRLRNFVFGRAREVLKSFGFEEYDGPMLESFDLYAAKTSEEIVNEQLYWLIDRGDRKLAIRPEMTPTLARMVAARQNELPRPIRWFSIPNLWRYERPQRGRLREHWQVNVDVFGGEPLSEDLEVCQLIVAIMSAFGATDQYEVRLNHRGLSNVIFKKILGLTDERAAAIAKLFDRALKIGSERFREELEAFGLEGYFGDDRSKSKATIQVIESLIKPGDATSIDEMSSRHPVLTGDPHFIYLRTLLSKLQDLGIGSHFRYDPSIMRGFLYYTGTVLEVYDLHPENNRALFGGGRYDNLVGLFGGKPLPGVGFGMGDVTFANFLESHGLLPELDAPRGIFVAHLDESCFLAAQKLAAELRGGAAARGLRVPVITALETGKIKKHFASAEKLGARAIVFVGGDEIASGKYPIRHLAKGVELSGDASELLNHYLNWH